MSKFLRFGCSYQVIADTTCSATTIRNRRDEWIRLGVFAKLKHIALESYDRIVGLVLDQIAVDGSITKAPGGGEVAGRSRQRHAGDKKGRRQRPKEFWTARSIKGDMDHLVNNLRGDTSHRNRWQPGDQGRTRRGTLGASRPGGGSRRRRSRSRGRSAWGHSGWRLQEPLALCALDAIVPDRAVWSGIYAISGTLETTLSEIFTPDYVGRLEQARQRLLNDIGGDEGDEGDEESVSRLPTRDDISG